MRLTEKLGITVPPELAAPLPKHTHSMNACPRGGMKRMSRTALHKKNASEALRLYHAKRRAAKAKGGQ